jgi:hypothetical protein
MALTIRVCELISPTSTNLQMTTFRDQFIACREDGSCVIGRVEKYKDHPDQLPAPWHPAAPKFKKALEQNPDLEYQVLECRKFGGDCRSGHPDCQKLRGYE